MRILLVEDNTALATALGATLRRKGFVVEHAPTLAMARALWPTAVWGLVLLDLHLPDGDGLAFLSSLNRQHSDTTVIILTARDQISDRIRGLDAGADDYITKPFDPDELLARLRAIERRRAGAAQSVLRLGDVSIDLARQRVERAGESVFITAKEWALLRVLASRPDRVHTREALNDALYGLDDDTGSNTLEVFISNLRRKIGREHIQTLRGIGYRLLAPPTNPQP
jgi:two-component system, OmpR family, response regulator